MELRGVSGVVPAFTHTIVYLRCAFLDAEESYHCLDLQQNDISQVLIF